MGVIEWARHGQNVANLTNTFSHRVFDGDLTELGREQATRLAVHVSSRISGRPEFLVCSPLRRARQTAEIVATHLDLPIELELDELRELNVGALDGCCDAAAWAEYRSVLNRWRHGDIDARFTDGESCVELTDRLRSALSSVATAAGERPALICAHGANLRSAIPHLAEIPEPEFDLPTGGIATLRINFAVTGCGIALESWPQQTDTA